jgi:hypothetical protein
MNRELGFGRARLPHQVFFFLKCAMKQALSVLLPLRLTAHLIDAYRQLTGRRKKWI